MKRKSVSEIQQIEEAWNRWKEKSDEFWVLVDKKHTLEKQRDQLWDQLKALEGKHPQESQKFYARLRASQGKP